jgi:hypothetical protein
MGWSIARDLLGDETASGIDVGAQTKTRSSAKPGSANT